MRTPLSKYVLLLFCSLACANGRAQLVSCPEIPSDPNSYCVVCNLNDRDTTFGTTIGQVPSGQRFTWCDGQGIVDNDQYFGFYPNGPCVEFEVNTGTCYTGSGIQAALFDEFGESVACLPDTLIPGSTFTLAACDLDARRPYYLGIDGFAGSDCDFEIVVLSGIDPRPTYTDTIAAPQVDVFTSAGARVSANDTLCVADGPIDFVVRPNPGLDSTRLNVSTGCSAGYGLYPVGDTISLDPRCSFGDTVGCFPRSMQVSYFTDCRTFGESFELRYIACNQPTAIDTVYACPTAALSTAGTPRSVSDVREFSPVSPASARCDSLSITRTITPAPFGGDIFHDCDFGSLGVACLDRRDEAPDSVLCLRVGEGGCPQTFRYRSRDAALTNAELLDDEVFVGDTAVVSQESGLQFAWRDANGDLAGATPQSSRNVFAEPGTYVVEVSTSGGCTRTLTVEVARVVGTRDASELAGALSLRIAPNPAESRLSIAVGLPPAAREADLRSYRLRAVNAAGQEVWVGTPHFASPELTTELDVSTWPAGAYRVVLTDGRGAVVTSAGLTVR